MRSNKYYFLFFQVMITIFLIYSSCKAMNDQEDQKNLINEQQAYLLENNNTFTTVETVNLQTSNNEQLTAPKTKSQKCGRWLLNNKVAWFTIAITGTAAVIGYKYYSLLDKECHKMEGACDEAVNDIDKIMQEVNLLKTQLTTVYSFIQQCPTARNDFLPKLITFAQQCCLEQ